MHISNGKEHHPQLLKDNKERVLAVPQYWNTEIFYYSRSIFNIFIVDYALNLTSFSHTNFAVSDVFDPVITVILWNY